MKHFIALALSGALLAATSTILWAEGGVSGAIVKDPTVQKECSACHLAFPAQFLPQRSWQAIMSDLPNHFGEDASLPAETVATIQDYLVANAADANPARAGKGVMRGIKDTDTPLRITELPWWKRAHGEVSPKRFTSDKIKSASNCAACHTGAAKGYFGDD